MLAAGGAQRASATPDVPSRAEAIGERDVETDIWYGLYAPARTPAGIVARLNAAVNAHLNNPEVADLLGKQGLQPTGGSPADLERITRSDLARWAKVVREANIKAD